ncbi:MAG: hypothetical protein HQ536_00325 [Parcubacteria group bacterium]|nr:hypothetical protein [Parcubacteria group bacterium]
MQYQEKGRIKEKRTVIATEDRGKRYKNALVFPSEKCNDVLLALKTKLFGKKTNLYCVEKDQKYADAISNQLKNKFNNLVIYNQKAHKIDLRSDLEGEKIDYCYYDICGGFSPQIAHWFYKNSDLLENNIRMAMTLCVNQWQDKGLKSFKEVNYKNQIVMKKVRDALEYVENDGFLALVQGCKKTYNNLMAQLNAVFLSMPSKHIIINYISLYQNYDISKKAKYMVFIDMTVQDSVMDTAVEKKLLRCINSYNEKVGYNCKIRTKKQKRKKTKQAKVMDIFQHKCYDDLSPQKRAWITRNAIEQGKNPVKVHASIKAKFTKKNKG